MEPTCKQQPYVRLQKIECRELHECVFNFSAISVKLKLSP